MMCIFTNAIRWYLILDCLVTSAIRLTPFGIVFNNSTDVSMLTTVSSTVLEKKTTSNFLNLHSSTVQNTESNFDFFTFLRVYLAPPLSVATFLLSIIYFCMKIADRIRSYNKKIEISVNHQRGPVLNTEDDTYFDAISPCV